MHIALYFLVGLSTAVLVSAVLLLIIKTVFRKPLNVPVEATVLVSSVSAFAGILTAFLIYQDMELKNRPYVYAQPKVIESNGNIVLSETTIKNCGNTPAYNVLCAPRLYLNGKEARAESAKTGTLSIYPNGEIFHHFPIKYGDGDNVVYMVRVRYENYNGRKYEYASSFRFSKMGDVYVWKNILSK